MHSSQPSQIIGPSHRYYQHAADILLLRQLINLGIAGQLGLGGLASTPSHYADEHDSPLPRGISPSAPVQAEM